MRIKPILMLSLSVLCSMACSKEEGDTTIPDISGRYEGYTVASCTYSQDCDPDSEQLTLATDDGGALG